MRRRALALLTILLVAVSGTAAASTASTSTPAGAAAESAPGGKLHYTETPAAADAARAWERSLAGSYTRGMGAITFASTNVSPVATDAWLTVNGHRVAISRDLGTGEARWSAAGLTLVPEDREVVRALDATLRARWTAPALEAKRALPQHQDLLFRLVMLLAEAPVGVALTAQDVPRPTETTGDKAVPLAPAMTLSQAGATGEVGTTASCIRDVTAVTAPGSPEQALALEACQGSDEDGIWYFANCNSYNRTTVHDANGHCILWESIYSGPASSECLGECGPGCGGLNIYTYDCGDHDRCGRVHGGSLNPWDAECGDEYFEADDDFIWGWPNCW